MTTNRLEELCEILAGRLTPNDANYPLVQPYIKSILLEFARTIQLGAVIKDGKTP